MIALAIHSVWLIVILLIAILAHRVLFTPHPGGRHRRTAKPGGAADVIIHTSTKPNPMQEQGMRVRPPAGTSVRGAP